MKPKSPKPKRKRKRSEYALDTLWDYLMENKYIIGPSEFLGTRYYVIADFETHTPIAKGLTPILAFKSAKKITRVNGETPKIEVIE